MYFYCSHPPPLFTLTFYNLNLDLTRGFSQKFWRGYSELGPSPVVDFFLSFQQANICKIFWFKFEVVFSRNSCRRPQNSFNGMVVVSGHLQPASGSTRTFLWLWMGGWSDKWHTQVLQHDYDEGVGERVGWENVPKIHQKLLKMSPISSDVVRRTCV